MAAETLEIPNPTAQLASEEVVLAASMERPRLEILDDVSAIATHETLRGDHHESTPEAQSSLSTRLVNGFASSRLGRAVVPTLAVLAPIGYGAGFAEKAAAGTPEQPAPAPSNIVQETSTTTVQFRVGKSEMSQESFSKATILANYRTISKSKIQKAEQQGNCVTIDGSKTNVWTQGHQEKGKPYGKDTRISRFCEWHGSWFRALCGNKAVFKKPHNVVPGPIIWVNNLGKANLTVSAKSEATAKAECKTDNTSAYGFGHGEGEAEGRIRISTFLKAKGKLKELITKNSLSASGEAKSNARAQAGAQCSEQNTSTTTTTTTPEQPPSKPPEQPPQPKPNLPPTTELVGPQHVLTGGEVQICEYESDPENDIAARHFSEQGNGNFISQEYQGNETGEWCIDYKAGTQADRATVTIQVWDVANNTATDSESFDIVDKPF